MQGLGIQARPAKSDSSGVGSAVCFEHSLPVIQGPAPRLEPLKWWLRVWCWNQASLSLSYLTCRERATSSHEEEKESTREELCPAPGLGEVLSKRLLTVMVTLLSLNEVIVATRTGRKEEMACHCTLKCYIGFKVSFLPECR